MIDAKSIIYIALTIGGTVGGLLTALNKVRFVSKSDCDKEKQSFCDKIDDLKSTVETNATESQDRREKDKTEFNDHLIKISKHMGAVEQYMRKNNRG